MNQQKPSRDLIDIVFDFLLKQCEKVVDLITNFLTQKRNEKKTLDATLESPQVQAPADDFEDEEVTVDQNQQNNNHFNQG